MKQEALIGYVAGRLIEVISRTKEAEKTSDAIALAAYAKDLRQTCQALFRLCMTHIDGWGDGTAEDKENEK